MSACSAVVREGHRPFSRCLPLSPPPKNSRPRLRSLPPPPLPLHTHVNYSRECESVSYSCHRPRLPFFLFPSVHPIFSPTSPLPPQPPDSRSITSVVSLHFLKSSSQEPALTSAWPCCYLFDVYTAAWELITILERLHFPIIKSYTHTVKETKDLVRVTPLRVSWIFLAAFHGVSKNNLKAC